MLDCVIVGGGAAGLTAATYLSRFRRNVLVIDAGETRLKRIPLARNVPGFPEGVAGRELHERLLKQASRYGAMMQDGVVRSVEPVADGFVVRTDVSAFRCRTVLLAMGVKPIDPKIEDLEGAIASGTVRYCPICDGFEASGGRVAVLGAKASAIEEAFFLRAYTDNLTFIPATVDAILGEVEAQAAVAGGITHLSDPPTGLRLADGGVEVLFAAAPPMAFEILYPCLGYAPRDAFIAGLGVAVSEERGVFTDEHQRTSVPGIYAAGDVLEGLDQISAAWGQAAIAATAIHNDLRRGLSAVSWKSNKG